MDLTSQVLALSSVWQYRIPPPIIVAAYQDAKSATADFALKARNTNEKGRQELDRAVDALFVRRLEMPIAEDIGQTLVNFTCHSCTTGVPPERALAF
jgi:hypothetical protein